MCGGDVRSARPARPAPYSFGHDDLLLRERRAVWLGAGDAVRARVGGAFDFSDALGVGDSCGIDDGGVGDGHSFGGRVLRLGQAGVWPVRRISVWVVDLDLYMGGCGALPGALRHLRIQFD